MVSYSKALLQSKFAIEVGPLILVKTQSLLVTGLVGALLPLLLIESPCLRYNWLYIESVIANKWDQFIAHDEHEDIKICVIVTHIIVTVRLDIPTLLYWGRLIIDDQLEIKC